MTAESRLADQSKQKPLLHWIWRSFLRVALLPIVVVELSLVLAYVITNYLVWQANVEKIQQIAEQDLAELAGLQASTISEQLESVTHSTRLLQSQVAEALDNSYQPPASEIVRYQLTSQGVYATARSGGAAAFFSAANPLTDQVKQRIWHLAQLDPLMKHMHETNSLVAQLYFNSYDSICRIYPYIDAAAQFGSHIVIPEYNFYYEADQQHNPARSVVWTEVYVDPAGLGWMSSAIAPVYRGDFLEGVVGIDVTIAKIVERVLDIAVPWQGFALLVSRDGVILAMQPEAEKALALTELTDYHYAQAILSDTFKPDLYNVKKRQDTAELELLLDSDRQLAVIDLHGSKVVSWAPIAQTGWRLVLAVPQQAVHSYADALSGRFNSVAVWIVIALMVFYGLFWLFLYNRSKSISQAITSPLLSLRQSFRQIRDGQYQQSLPVFKIAEIQQCADDLQDMGRQLGRTDTELRQAQHEAEQARQAQSHFLGRMSHEMRTPLNAVLGFAQLLELEPLTDEQRDHLSHIIRAGEHQLALVNELLRISDAGHSDYKLHITDVELQTVIQQAVALVENLAERYRISIVLGTDCDQVIRVSVDINRLRQCLFNLLDNAIKYNIVGGTVTIDCKKLDDGFVRLSIHDTGLGIGAGQQDRLFYVLDRLGREHGDIDGAGVGLVVTKHLVESMGGRIGYSTETDRGSVFWLDLPQAVS